MLQPAIVRVAGHNIRDKNWGVITEAMERSVQGIPAEWFENHRLILTWEETPPNTPPDNFDQISKSLLDLHNQQRTTVNLAPLQLDTKLQTMAKSHSAYMAKTGDFSHDEPGNSFSNRMRNAGLSYRSAGENIALSYPEPAAVMRGWMNSPGHRANILNRSFNRVGFGLVKSSSGRFYWTADFIQSVSASMMASLADQELELVLPGGTINPGSATILEEIPENDT